MPRDLDSLDPSAFYLLPTGIGSAFTSRYYHSSFLLFFGGEVTLVDVPAPLHRIVREAAVKAGLSLGLSQIDHVILTHLHGDHCNGVEELGFWRRYRAPESRSVPNLHLLEELRLPLWQNRLSASMGADYHEDKDPETSLGDYFRVTGLEPGQPCSFGPDGARLEVRRTQHFVPCMGFRMEWNGIQLGYSGDTAYDPDHIDFLSRCDFIIHETSEGRGHTSVEKLEALPEAIRSKMHLIHIPDDYDVEQSLIPVLKEGRLYKIEKHGE